MLQQTIDRLLPIAPCEHCWVITSDGLLPTIVEQLPELEAAHILAEPEARNTAPAAALAAFLLEREAPEAVMGLFPADHAVDDIEGFERILRAGCELAATGENIVVLGIAPNRPETGYGYIEAGSLLETRTGGEPVFHVRRFTEKPNVGRAKEFLAAGNYFWNSGMFLATALTFANAFREHLPETAPYLEQIAATFGTDTFAETLATVYPQCENISIDYAVLEPRSAKGEQRSNLYCIPADFGWNDLGSWAALYDQQLARGLHVAPGKNVVESVSESVLESNGNYVHAPQKHVALVGVDGLVIVETDDILLITTRAGCQDVGKLVKRLQQEKQDDLI